MLLVVDRIVCITTKGKTENLHTGIAIVVHLKAVTSSVMIPKSSATMEALQNR